MIQGTRSLPSNVRRSGSVYREGRWWSSEAAAKAGPKPTPHRDAAAKAKPKLVRHAVLEYLQSKRPPAAENARLRDLLQTKAPWE